VVHYRRCARRSPSSQDECPPQVKEFSSEIEQRGAAGRCGAESVERKTKIDHEREIMEEIVIVTLYDRYRNLRLASSSPRSTTTVPAGAA